MKQNNTNLRERASCTFGAAFLSAPHIMIATIIFVFLGALLPGPALAENDHQAPNTIHQITLFPGLQCSISDDGAMVLSLGDSRNASSIVVLEGKVLESSQFRRVNRQTLRAPFSMLVRQGAAGGRRGFSSQADDDGDGLTDEDVLDALDNDGDGLVDEDFAAIADAMVVVDLHDGHQGSHQEFYHWSYARLQSAVFAKIAVRNALDEPTSGWLRFDLPESIWREADIRFMRHTQSGRPEFQNISAFVAEIPGVLDSGSLWLGAIVLDKSVQDLAGKLGHRVRLENGILDIPTGESSLPVVLCAAESWSQLSRAITEAQVVYDGTTDPINGIHVPWIVSPGCNLCRTAASPEVQWERLGETGLRLNFQIGLGMNACLDPDLFSVYGIHLGSPSDISWYYKELPFSSRVWKRAALEQICMNPSAFNTPYSTFSGLEGHAAGGVLGFDFPILPEEIYSQLEDWMVQEGGKIPIQGVYMDGQQARFSAGVPSSQQYQGTLTAGIKLPAPEPQDLSSIDQLALNSDLLTGYPNPFKETITIRFGIPETMESAFKVPNGTKWPSDWDKAAPVPWENGSPTVSVKVYNINGQELRTLYEGNHHSGDFTVGWDGNDAFGRQVASGTYFCKLQLDKWSVTRRVIFLR